MTVLTDWVRDYRAHNKCSLQDAVSAFRALPKDHPVKIDQHREHTLRNAAPLMLDALERISAYCCEFGNGNPDLCAIEDIASRALSDALRE